MLKFRLPLLFFSFIFIIFQILLPLKAKYPHSFSKSIQDSLQFTQTITTTSIISSTIQPTNTISIDDRLERVETVTEELAEASENASTLNIIASILTGINVIGLLLLGIWTNNLRHKEGTVTESKNFRDSELKTYEIIQGFMKYLTSENQKEVEGALIAISELGEIEFAARLASIYQSSGAVSALIKLAEGPNIEQSEIAKKALYNLSKAFEESLPFVSCIKDLTNRILGTGFLISSHNLVITTAFALETSNSFSITINGNQYQLNNIGITPDLTTGLVTFELPENIMGGLDLFSTGRNFSVKNGDELFILGSLSDGGLVVVSSPIISINETIPYFPGINFITLNVSSGSREFRGAPVLNRNHLLVGVVLQASSSTNMINNNLVYVIPVQSVRQVIQSQSLF